MGKREWLAEQFARIGVTLRAVAHRMHGSISEVDTAAHQPDRALWYLRGDSAIACAMFVWRL
jgi:hypothetical protein